MSMQVGCFRPEGAGGGGPRHGPIAKREEGEQALRTRWEIVERFPVNGKMEAAKYRDPETVVTHAISTCCENYIETLKLCAKPRPVQR
jgi:hypothetical protein